MAGRLPSGDADGRTALALLGLEFALDRTTEEAKALLDGDDIRVVISDFRRPQDPADGQGLLDHLVERGLGIPWNIYTATADAAQVRAAPARGAFGQTHRPRELFGLVVAALQRSALATASGAAPE